MSTAVVVFTRDLRADDQPALAGPRCDGDTVVPLFVFDDAILGSAFNRPNRTGFPLESLTDLDAQLRTLGAALVVRRGDWVEQVVEVVRATDATSVHVSGDVSAFAQRRESRTARRGDAWLPRRRDAGRHRRRTGRAATPARATATTTTRCSRRTGASGVATEICPLAKRPSKLALPPGLDTGAPPALADLVSGGRPGQQPGGGTTAAHRLLDEWVHAGLRSYDERHDDLPGDATSRLSPHLHFGTVSPGEIAAACAGREGAEPFLRQLCWRDFYTQILAARPDAAWNDYRERGDRWNVDPDTLAAWKAGRTGYPVVDAGMRQLAQEGFVHNRARMIVASFLTKDLYVDWRAGARHYLDLLLDGDLANNNLNWQWVAGTGTDTNPHRIFNPTVQGKRFDPDGEYVRRYVPELVAVKGGAVHEPDANVRRAYDYPAPIVDHHLAIEQYKSRRA
ncbi:MAG: deoxyribodipyrimidine photo-lyase [Acidimicrobiia bacterium]